MAELTIRGVAQRLCFGFNNFRDLLPLTASSAWHPTCTHLDRKRLQRVIKTATRPDSGQQLHNTPSLKGHRHPDDDTNNIVTVDVCEVTPKASHVPEHLIIICVGSNVFLYERLTRDNTNPLRLTVTCAFDPR